MFNVLTPIFKFDVASMHLAIQAFEQFFDEITPKHRKKIKLTLVLNKIQQNIYSEYSSQSLTGKMIQMIPDVKGKEIETAWQQASICFLPDAEGAIDLFNKALLHHLPVLAYASKMSKKSLDNSCSILLPYKTNSQEGIFAQKLKMLYFDPGARKMLVQGARKKWKLMNRLAEKSN